MIQTVGIKFEAQGLNTVIADMRALSTAVKSLTTGIKGLENINITTALNNLNSFATGISNAASRLVAAANQITAATSSFSAASNAMSNVATTGTKTTGTTGSSGKKADDHRGVVGDTMVTTGRLLKYSAAFGLVYGAKQALGGLLGSGRADMADPAFRLAGVGITNREDKRAIEDSVTEFLKRNPYMGKISEGVSGAAELASAIPFGDKQFPTLNMDMLNRMNQMNMVYAKLAEMTPKQAADSGVLAMNAMIAHKPRAEQQQFYTQPGKMEGLYDQILGMQQKAIDISKLTGQDIAEFNKHALPLLLSRGWDYQSALAVAASEKDIGLRVSSGGRAMKNLYTHEDKVGLMMALGDPDEKRYQRLARMKKGAQLEEGYKYFQQVKEATKGDAFDMLQIGAKAKERLQSRRVNIQKLISAEFAQYFEELFNQDFIQFMGDKRRQIGKEWLNSAQREMLTDKAQSDENPRLAALSQKTDAMMKQLGRTPGDAENTPAGALYTVADYALNAATLLATALTEPPKALDMLTIAAKTASDRFNGLFETKETKDARAQTEDALLEVTRQKYQMNAIDAGGKWPQATYGWPFDSQARYNPMPGFSMFNSPNFSNIEPSPGIRVATSEERQVKHEVQGNATVSLNVTFQDILNGLKKVLDVPLSENRTTGNSTSRPGYNTNIYPRVGGYGE